MNSPSADAVTLYGLSRSVYTRIARLALHEKEVKHRLEEVEIFGKEGVPRDHLKRHPFGRIPSLRHGDFSIFETAAITRYIDEIFAGPELQPDDARQRARMMQIIGLLDSYAYRPMVWGVFVQRVRIPLRGGKADEAVVSAALPVVERCLDVLEGLLESRPFFTGDKLSLADLHATPMLLYVVLAPEGEMLIAKHSGIKRWLAAMRGRRSVQDTRTEYEAGYAADSNP